VFGGKSHEFLVDFFRVLPGNPGQAIDGVFVHPGQACGPPNAVLLEKVIQDSYGLVQRKSTA
jgi:hypothetical protein